MAVPLTALLSIDPDGGVDPDTALALLEERQPVAVPTLAAAGQVLAGLGLSAEQVATVVSRAPLSVLGEGKAEVATVTGTYEGEAYSVQVTRGDVWPGDRSIASSKVAAVVLCSTDLADSRSVLDYLAQETKVDSISGSPGLLKALADFQTKAYSVAQPRDERGRWIAVQTAIASLKVAAHTLLRRPGVNRETGLQQHLANAAGAARARDKVGTKAALDRANAALNGLGPAVIGKPDGAGLPHQHPDLVHVQDLLDEALQAHADLVVPNATVGRTPTWQRERLDTLP